MFYEALGYLALVLNIWGNLALAKKSTVGWLIRLACNFAWIVYSFTFCIWPLFINHIIFAGINVYGWIEWTKDTYICACGRKYTKKDNNTNCICELPIKFME